MNKQPVAVTIFGGGAAVVTDFLGDSDRAFGVAVTSDHRFGRGLALALHPSGDIVLAGGQNGDFAVARYLGRAGAAPVH